MTQNSPQLYSSEEHVFLEIYDDSTYVIQSDISSPLGCFINTGKVHVSPSGWEITFEPETLDTTLVVSVSDETAIENGNATLLVLTGESPLVWDENGWINRGFKLSYSINGSPWRDFFSDTTLLFIEEHQTSPFAIQFRRTNFYGRYNCTKLKTEFFSEHFQLNKGALYEVVFNEPSFLDVMYKNTNPMEGRIINDSFIYLKNGVDSSFNQLFYKGRFYPNLDRRMIKGKINIERE
jgi:hypothetical protein